MAADVVLVEELSHGLPKRARLPRRPLVPHGLANQHEPASRPRAGGGEQEPVTASGIGSNQPRTPAFVEHSAGVLVEERLDAGTPRQRSLLQPENEHGVEAPCPGAHQVEHGDPSGCARAVTADGRTLERREHVRAADLVPKSFDRLELVEPPYNRVVRPEVRLRPRSERRSRRAVRAAQHRVRQRSDSGDGRHLVQGEIERRQCPPVAKLNGDLGRAVAAEDAPPSEPSFDPVDVLALEPRVRRAKVRVQLRPLAVEPRETQQGEERVAERRRPKSGAALERDRDPQPGERRPECEPDRLDRRADDRDLLRRDAGPDERQRLLRHELERAARPRTLEEPDRAVEQHASRGVGEQVPLDVRQPRRQELLCARRQLDDVAARKGREVFDGSPERGIDRAPGLVGEGDVDVGARRQRLEQSPLGAGEVLEAMREDGVVAPCVQVPGQPLDGASPQHPAVPRVEPVELRAVRPGQRGQWLVQVVGLQETPVELCERATDRLRVSRETRALCRSGVGQPSQQQAPLGVP